LLGSLAIGFSTLFAGLSLFAKIFLSQSPRGFTALVFLITFLSGVLLLFLGIIGEYVGRIYEEVKARPLYIVNKIIDQTSIREAERGPKMDAAEAANRVRDNQ
jgi:dolichol-phosphate mannosyltransferase